MTHHLGGTYALRGTPHTVHRMGYGAMQLAGPHVWGPPKDEAAAIAVLRAAIAAGVNHIDTADFYGPYVTNELIRKALSPYPEDLAIVTKVGYLRKPDESWYPAASKQQLTEAVHSNLRNLGLEHLPVVNLRLGNAAGPSDASLKEPLEALLELRHQGLIGAIGLSTVSMQQVQEAETLTDIACVQNQYNIAHREDDSMVAELAEKGIAYVPYFPLGGFSPLQSSALDDVATSLEATPMQVALAWLLQRSPNILLIPGTSSVAHLNENLQAATLQLSPDSIKALDNIGAKA